jgi:hypothetical protein
MLSSSKRTALAEADIPTPFDQFSVGLHHRDQVAQCAGVEPVACSEPDLGLEPEFGLAAAGPHVLHPSCFRISRGLIPRSTLSHSDIHATLAA